MSQTKTSPTSLAVIADVHGNRWALEAVLQDIDRRGIHQIVNLGDHLTGPLDPAGTADLLLARTMVHVCGNDDRDLFLPQEERSLSQNYTCSQLTPAHFAWLRSLPDTTVVGDELFVCHGDLFDTPYLLEEVTQCGVCMRRAAAIATSVAKCVALQWQLERGFRVAITECVTQAGFRASTVLGGTNGLT